MIHSTIMDIKVIRLVRVHVEPIGMLRIQPGYALVTVLLTNTRILRNFVACLTVMANGENMQTILQIDVYQFVQIVPTCLLTISPILVFSTVLQIIGTLMLQENVFKTVPQCMRITTLADVCNIVQLINLPMLIIPLIDAFQDALINL